ncbi:MAG: uncharacterized protein QOH34_2514, partial [Mycobacterium sp.]|nr:uncharacterized protein [Mycobacterium sp.]
MRNPSLRQSDDACPEPTASRHGTISVIEILNQRYYNPTDLAIVSDCADSAIAVWSAPDPINDRGRVRAAECGPRKRAHDATRQTLETTRRDSQIVHETTSTVHNFLLSTNLKERHVSENMSDFRALDPFFRIIEEGLAGLVDGDHFFDLLAEDVDFDFIITVPNYPRH